MNWFGRKSATLPAAYPSWSTLGGATDANTLPGAYAARVHEVFVDNPVGQRSVRLVAGTISA